MDERVKVGIAKAFLRVGLMPQPNFPFLGRRYRFQPDSRIQALLAPELAALERWEASDQATIPEGELAALFFSSIGLIKWPHYLPVYERALHPFRQRPVRLLEIGVDRGGSLKAWNQYLGPGSIVVGIDIGPDCARYEDASAGRYVRIGAQQDVAFLRGVTEEFGPFDVIIDDGSHRASHLIASFQYLFPHALAGGGVYLAEDLQASYWPAYRDVPESFIDFAKGLVDLMHAHYQATGVREPQFRMGSDQRLAGVSVPGVTRLLDWIEFHDGLVVVHKAPSPRELPTSIRVEGSIDSPR